MAILIPTLAQCADRMTPGEKRTAKRLIDVLSEDTIVWFGVAIGASTAKPDFIILDPERGILVLEVKDWRSETIKALRKDSAELLVDHDRVVVERNPLLQARDYAERIASLLQHEQTLIRIEGPHRGKLILPWGYGVILTNISRAAFDRDCATRGVGTILPPSHVLCRDDLSDEGEPEEFRRRLWFILPWSQPRRLTHREVDSIRWHVFPEIRVTQAQLPLFADKPADSSVDLLRVMDLRQEQIARGLGAGHRVIHGVAGSGKTMVLRYRAMWLARAKFGSILVLCYNRALATWLGHLIRGEIGDGVTVRTFHGWCREQLLDFGLPLPPQGLSSGDFAQALVKRVRDGVERGIIPRGRYHSVLVDEAHDMEPEWLSIITHAVSPETDALLVLYDGAQSIYGRKRFSLRSVGVKAQGRTTIFRINYRCTAEILQFAYDYARNVLAPQEDDEDHVPLLLPEAGGRHGLVPRVQVVPDRRSEIDYVIGRLRAFHESGYRWRDMAVLERTSTACDSVAGALRQAGVPVTVKEDYRPDDDAVTVITYHSSKGLEFPIVAIPGLPMAEQPMPPSADDIRLLYVAMTRAMEHLLLTSLAPAAPGRVGR